MNSIQYCTYLFFIRIFSFSIVFKLDNDVETAPRYSYSFGCSRVVPQKRATMGFWDRAQVIRIWSGIFGASQVIWVSRAGWVFFVLLIHKTAEASSKIRVQKLEKEGEVDPENCVTKIIIRQAVLELPPQARNTSSSVTSLKSQITKLNAMGFTWSVIPYRE